MIRRCVIMTLAERFSKIDCVWMFAMLGTEPSLSADIEGRPRRRSSFDPIMAQLPKMARCYQTKLFIISIPCRSVFVAKFDAIFSWLIQGVPSGLAKWIWALFFFNCKSQQHSCWKVVILAKPKERKSPLRILLIKNSFVAHLILNGLHVQCNDNCMWFPFVINHCSVTFLCLFSFRY